MIRRVSLWNAFRNAMLSDPDGSRKDAFAHFLQSMQSDPAYLKELAQEYFDRNAAQWKIEHIGKNVSLVGTAAVQKRAEVSAAKRAENAKIVQERLAEIKATARAVLTLDFVMPNGKRLRDCTGAETERFGGIFSEIARHVKPTQVVGHHINARELANLCQRFEPKRRSGGHEARMHA